MVVFIGFSCEKELPIYDERDGYVEGSFNGEEILSSNNTEEYYIRGNYTLYMFCEPTGAVGFSYKMKETNTRIFVDFYFEDINKISGKCFDIFDEYDRINGVLGVCITKPTLHGCYFDFDNCDVDYMPDPIKVSTIHIDKVTEKYITGKMDVNLISKFLPDNFPWTRFQPKTIHLKVDQFVAVKR